MEPLTIKIDVTKLKEDAFYRGQKGIYCTLTVWPNDDGQPDKFGNDASVKQSLGKDRRDEPSPYVGSAKIIRRKQDAPAPKPQTQTMKQQWDDAEEVPF